ncbi:MAG: DUF3658 domain-containing protein [Thermodesulfobacteriota bacterium]
MASLRSIHDHLQMAVKYLDQAASEIIKLPLEPTKINIGNIGGAIGSIMSLLQHIYQLQPELRPNEANNETPKPDRELTKEEIELIDKLSYQDIHDIDNILLSHAQSGWRKVAMVVAKTMSSLENRKTGIPDIFYAQRVRKLVE